MERDTRLPDPDFPPYSTLDFFMIIRTVKEDTVLNPVYLSVNQWYQYLLETQVTTCVIDDEGRREQIPNRVE